MGEGDFKSVGETYAKWIIELAGLTGKDRILDVGCGIGRMAVPLIAYLGSGRGVRRVRCRRRGDRVVRQEHHAETPQLPFSRGRYLQQAVQPQGKSSAQPNGKFPYEDGYFDVVFLGSVFTHMRPADTAHYIHEISRVLKNGGRCFATFFILNAVSLASIKSGRSSRDFQQSSRRMPYDR